MIRVGAQGLKLLAECLLSPYLSLFATPSPMLPLKAQVGKSSTETGLRGRGQVRKLSRVDNSTEEKVG